MTKVKIIKKNNNIVCVEAIGHTNYKMSGEDIVCSALSSIIQTASLGLLTVVGVKAEIIRDDKKAYYKITLPNSLSKQEKHDANIVLNTMLAGVKDLVSGYSNFIELEVI